MKLFRESHIDLFECSEKYRGQARDAAKWMDALGQEGQCGTHMIDGRILFIGSWFMVAPGVAEVCLLPSIYVPQYRKSFYAEVKWWITNLLSRDDVKRIQSWGEETLKSDRWLKSLGFEREGLLYCYGPAGENVSIWGRVKQCKP